MGCSCAFRPDEGWKVTVLRWLQCYKPANPWELLFPFHSDVLIDKTQGSLIFSILDLWSLYPQVRIRPPDIPRTAFVAPFGHVKYLVVPFGRTNALSTFQTLMKSLLGTYTLFLFTSMTYWSSARTKLGLWGFCSSISSHRDQISAHLMDSPGICSITYWYATSLSTACFLKSLSLKTGSKT